MRPYPPAWRCEHGRVNGIGCEHCDSPMEGINAAVLAALLGLVVVALVVALLAWWPHA